MASGELLAAQATTKFKVWAPHGQKGLLSSAEAA